MRPTGPLHIGHLLGALDNWVSLQKRYECFFMIADWHALMSEYENPHSLDEHSRQMMVDWMSCGIDPAQSTVFVQSSIPEHLELFLTFSLLVPLGWLERNPTYKEQLREIKGRTLTTYAFLGYPVLQAADIAIYRAETVPVGEDQLPHLELTREIVRRFNTLYGLDFFPEPEGLLTETPRLKGLDNRKMSKSYHNYIALRDTPEEIYAKVKGMITDPARVKLSDKGHPDTCNVFSYYRLFFSPDEVEEARRWCTGALKGCTECKKGMAARLVERLRPIRARREWLERDIDGRVMQPIAESSRRAHHVAAETMEAAKRMLHLLRNEETGVR